MKKAWLAILLAATILLPMPHNVRANAFPNEDKHHAMLRLEDVSPGGDYETPEDLGRLRAVFDYLEQQHVPFHVATISREKHLKPDGTWYDKGIDDPNPDANVQQFIDLLKHAEASGAVLGMHGYTHQYGDQQLPDNTQNSGTGFEFNVKDAPETDSADYAADKITKSLAAFEKAGLTPGFWESPHYHDTREQEDVFRSYMGVLYQPDYRSLRSLKDLNVYESENVYGSPTLGSVYVPAPLKYIQDRSSVTQVLDKLATYQGLGSMYYHPFLEFPFLEAKKDASGKPVMKDGLPVFTYKAGDASNLHLLVEGFRAKGYVWESLYDVVPFSPAHRIDLPLGTKPSDILLGDLTGDGQHGDVVVREGDGVEVISGNYAWPRNRAQKPARMWLKETIPADDTLMLFDVNHDGRDDLVTYSAKTSEVRAYVSTGFDFSAGKKIANLPGGYSQILAADTTGSGHADLLLRKGNEVFLARNEHDVYPTAPQKVLTLKANATLRTGDFNGDRREDLMVYTPDDRTVRLYTQEGGAWKQVQALSIPKPGSDAQVLTGDTNGDGKTDVIVCDAANGIWQVLQSGQNFTLQPLDNLFGPWASGSRVPYAADFDGNGKADLASYDEDQHVLDLALSFQTGKGIHL